MEQTQDSLRKYQTATEDGLKKVTLTWQDNLDKQLSEITGSDIEFKDAGNGNVQMYANGVKAGEAKPKDEMAKVVENTILEISKQETGAEAAGKNLLEGIKNGIGNKEKQNSVFGKITSFGQTLLSKLKSSLQEHSPSKATEEDGVNLLLGLVNGVKKKEKSILKYIKNFGQNIVNTLNNELDVDLNTNFRGSLNGIKNNLSMSNEALIKSSTLGGISQGNSNISNSNVNNFTQNIYAPRQPSRFEIYRDTKNLLNLAKGG